jgi:hypothetical protein
VADEIGCQAWQPIALIVAPTILDSDVIAFDEADLTQTLPERSDKVRRAGRGRASEEAYHRQRGLLPLCRERPRSSRTAEQRDELAPSHHSITSSARASRDGGTVRPSTLAVCVFMISSKLLDWTTGRSEGAAPLRMRPT